METDVSAAHAPYFRGSVPINGGHGANKLAIIVCDTPVRRLLKPWSHKYKTWTTTTSLAEELVDTQRPLTVENARKGAAS